MDATIKRHTSGWGWLHRRTTGWQWLALGLLALVVPPLALLIAVPLAIARWKIPHEWLAWSTLIVFSGLLTVLFGSIVVRNGSLR